MPDFLVIIFWVWFAAGALILLHRLATTGTVRAGGSKRSREVEADRAESERQATAERHAAFEAQLAAFAPADAPAEATANAADRPASPSNPDGLLPAAARARTLADALEGIHMPADLVPLHDERPDPRHLLFATDTTPAETVGKMLADELERIGFNLTPIDERSIAAVRPNARVEVRLLPDHLAAISSPLAGRVSPGSVVAEFQLA